MTHANASWPDRARRGSTLILASGTALAMLALTGGSALADPVTITCGACQESPSDPFLQYNYEAAQRFNEANEGTYRVEVRQNQYANSGGAERLQYYQRLALADDLPDVFLLNATEMKALQGTGKLRDLSGDLDANPEWKECFLNDVFTALSNETGEIWAIPQQRDAIGIFYNKALFAEAGYDSFPQTWNEFEAAAAKLDEMGTMAIAMDGGWSTLLMWTNLIGTSPEGKAFLTSGIKDPAAYLESQAVVESTERLKSWHTEGYVNADAFSGEFQNAAAAYLSGEAAAIANGPWMVRTQITSDAAIEGLYENTGYAPSPGWNEGERGVIVVTGAGWSSGHVVEDDGAEAVVAFLRFLSSPEEQLIQAQQTGARPAVEIDAGDMQASKLEPLGAQLAEQADELTYTYPHWRVHAPGTFLDAWQNLWPAYVKGGMQTEEFLERLGNDAAGKQ